jgi:hypothetical protein
LKKVWETLMYGILFLSGIYYCLRVFWCAAARMSEFEFAKTVSRQVMKHGSTNTSLKQSSKVHDGRLPIPHDQKILRKSKSRVKTMLLTCFEISGTVHYEFVPTGQTFHRVLEKLREKSYTKATRTFCH